MKQLPNNFEALLKRIEKISTFRYMDAGNMESDTMKIKPQSSGYVGFCLYGKEDCPLCGKGKISTDTRFFLNIEDIDQLMETLKEIKKWLQKVKP